MKTFLYLYSLTCYWFFLLFFCLDSHLVFFGDGVRFLYPFLLTFLVVEHVHYAISHPPIYPPEPEICSLSKSGEFSSFPAFNVRGLAAHALSGYVAPAARDILAEKERKAAQAQCTHKNLSYGPFVMGSSTAGPFYHHIVCDDCKKNVGIELSTGPRLTEECEGRIENIKKRRLGW